MKKHKNLMVVGTSSGAGKSITVTGLCRIFSKDGFKTAPFKSQNMSLNSYITKNGLEIGRAQGVQAVACNIEPEGFMNPILLKPTADRYMQVVLNGKSIGNMTSLEYKNYKPQLKVEILNSYKNIEENYDICVLEGAGSPVEINMNQDDIVNMGLAHMVDAPVLLVADIDRGGVFASIYGTIMLMDPHEKARVKGVIINKFHGNPEGLRSGIEKIEALTGVPVLGIMPFTKLDIEDEDSVSERLKKRAKDRAINISVIRLKHLSNFTDINPLESYPDVSVKYITSADELGDEDMIVIPGSKNTIEDLKDIKDKGIAEKIVRASRGGTMVFGICGGFQILGQKVSDPHGIESSVKELPGLGLLDVETIMKREKNTTQSLGQVLGMDIKGYEIHQGISLGEEKELFVTSEKKNSLTFVQKGDIYGTYLHGIFDNFNFTDLILNTLREKKGLELSTNTMTFEEYREHEFDKLEKVMRENLDMKKIYAIMGMSHDICD